MPRAAAAAVLTPLLAAAVPASADPPKPPDAARVRTAAEQFDAGVAAFKAKDFEGAASHFEAADAAVPSPKALRQAIRARAEAAQGSRAATLAALALDRYPDDDATSKLAKETIEKVRAVLYKASVTCAPACSLAVQDWAVPGKAATKRVIYLDPGTATVKASFAGQDAASREIEAKPGEAGDVKLEPRKKKPAPAPVVPVSDSKSELPPEDPKPEAP